MFRRLMDVRCEKCKTEYEFDDARITEAGVTVKCTTCSHVFKVKKKALVVTVPVKDDEAAAELGLTPTLPPAAAPAAGAADKSREWKVRQANGNVFNFKELTTLQKWIVERKVTRDDEISLTGESWKRLGNIAELASFFQVVEEAQKAQQLSALQTGGYLPYQQPAPPPPPSPQPAPPSLGPPGMSGHPPQQPASVNVPMDVMGVVPAQATKTPTSTFGMPPGPAADVALRRGGAVRSAERRPVEDDDEYEALRRKKGGAGKWIGLLLLLGALGAGGYYGYFNYYLPMLQQQAVDQKRVDEERLSQQDGRTAVGAAEPSDANAVEDAGVADAGVTETTVDAGLQETDAGVAEVEVEVDAGVFAPVKRAPPRNYDWFIAQGDRLRDRGNPEASLDLYGRAEELKPDRAEPFAGKGLALLDMGQKPAAEAAFQQALKLNPRYGVALMGLAETYRAMGSKANAIKYYERYLEVLPNGREAPVATEAIRRLKSE